MSNYKVTLLVSEKVLPTLLGVIEQTKGITMETIALVKEGEEAEAKTKAGFHYANGKKNKGVKGEDLALQILADGKVHHQDEVKKAFIAKGFADSSFSPSLSTLVKKKKIKALGSGKFQLA